MDSEIEKTARPRRRWLRFSLRTLLIMVTVSAVLLGWVGWERQQVRRERETIAKERATLRWINDSGGRIASHPGVGPDERSWWEKTTDKRFGERVWRVWRVSFRNTQVSDLSPLAELKNLVWLDLESTQVSDLSPLAELRNLEWVRLNDTQVSDEQVQELRQALPNCVIRHSSRVEK